MSSLGPYGKVTLNTSDDNIPNNPPPSPSLKPIETSVSEKALKKSASIPIPGKSFKASVEEDSPSLSNSVREILRNSGSSISSSCSHHIGISPIDLAEYQMQQKMGLSQSQVEIGDSDELEEKDVFDLSSGEEGDIEEDALSVSVKSLEEVAQQEATEDDLEGFEGLEKLHRDPSNDEIGDRKEYWEEEMDRSSISFEEEVDIEINEEVEKILKSTE